MSGEIETSMTINSSHCRYREEIWATYIVLTAEWTGTIEGTALERKSRNYIKT